jgi:hypothetical protein
MIKKKRNEECDEVVLKKFSSRCEGGRAKELRLVKTIHNGCQKTIKIEKAHV